MPRASYVVAGKVAIVTGAARGIGVGTAQALAWRARDVTDRGAMRQVIATVVQERGGVDVRSSPTPGSRHAARPSGR